DLEVQVGDGRERVAGVADEPDHLARLHVPGVERELRVAGEVRVVELVAPAVADPQAPPAEPLPADPVQRAVGGRDDRRAEHGEDVVAVVPAARDVAPGRAVRVAEVRLARDGEKVRAAGGGRGGPPPAAPRPPAAGGGWAGG